MNNPEQNGSRSETIHIARVDDVWERTIRCEERITALDKDKASKEDLAKTRAWLIVTCVGLVVAFAAIAFYSNQTIP